jgi:hypothetical protein
VANLPFDSEAGFFGDISEDVPVWTEVRVVLQSVFPAEFIEESLKVVGGACRASALAANP